ncbi:MAG: hypothetical protein ACREMS_02425 [Gemmatimonadaceae bacterium]
MASRRALIDSLSGELWRQGDIPTAGGFMMIKWAVILGAVGFALGFIGPMILDPSSGNGPLLGIFITGPAGFVIGLVVGWFRSRSAPTSPLDEP